MKSPPVPLPLDSPRVMIAMHNGFDATFHNDTNDVADVNIDVVVVNFGHARCSSGRFMHASPARGCLFGCRRGLWLMGFGAWWLELPKRYATIFSSILPQQAHVFVPSFIIRN